MQSDQSSLVQANSKKKFLTNHFFFLKKYEEKKCRKKCYFQLRRIVLDQSSPVHPVSESRGGGVSVTHGRTNG